MYKVPIDILEELKNILQTISSYNEGVPIYKSDIDEAKRLMNILELNYGI